jgi:hypothetical protein
MLESNRKNLYIGGLVIISLVILYFVHSYQTKRLIRDELKSLEKEKKRKLVKKMMKEKILNSNKQNEYPENKEDNAKYYNPNMNQNQIQIQNQREMDSYIDIDGDDGNDDLNDKQPSHSGSRVSANNIMMRDLMDGSQH